MIAPRRPGISFGVLTAALAALATLLVAPPAFAGADPEQDVAVKAAFLFNFAKFAEWPALASAASIAICVVGDDGTAAALADTIQGQSISGHGLTVLRPATPSFGDCHVLFVPSTEIQRANGGLAGIRTRPVLTVSDSKGFSQSGGIIEFYIEGGRMRFIINVDAAARAGLRLSSRLLGLAKVVKDGHVQ